VSTVITYVEQRRNRVANPRGNNLAGWNTALGTGGAGTASVVTQIDDHPLGITTAYRNTWTTAASNNVAGLRAGTSEATWGTPVTAGQVYTGSIYGRVNRARDVRAVLVWFDAAGATLSTTNGTLVTCTANAWGRYSLTATAPASAAWVRVGFYGANAPPLAGDVLDATGAMVEAGSALNAWFDGDTPDILGTTLAYSWVGTAHASQSVLRQELHVAGDDLTVGGWRPGSAITWGLGDYDNPALRFNGMDAFDVEWICETPEGWRRTTAETPVVEGGGDGGVFAPGRRKPKVLTLRGAFRCYDRGRMDAAEERLRAAVEYLTEDTVLWHGPLTSGSGPRQMSVRLSGELDVLEVPGNPRIRTFTAVLTAADPFRYAAGAAGLVTYTTGLTFPVNEGITFPVAFPLDFAPAARGGTVQGRIEAVNPGTLPAFPTTVFTGPAAPGLQLTNGRSGQMVGYADPLFDGQPVAFNHAARAVTGDGRSLFSKRLAGTEFFALAPNATSHLGFVAPVYNDKARVTLSFRPRWR
jgi:hypothetical protein